MRIIPGINVAVIEGDTTHAAWIEELGTIHHDPWMRDQVCRHIKPGDVVVQGGANIGTLTRAILDAGVKVFAFEPNPNACECLKYNCPEAVVIEFALSDRYHLATLHEDKANAGASWMESIPSGYYPKKPSGSYICESLDCISIVDESLVKLILLDVEGYEPRALRGAEETIARCRPVIICEVNRGALERAGSSEDELLSLIDSYGYNIRILQPECRRGDPQYDVEAMPK